MAGFERTDSNFISSTVDKMLSNSIVCYRKFVHESKSRVMWHTCLILRILPYDRPGFMHTGGLGGYGSGDSEDERSDRGSESSDTDDEELRHRIRQKQEAFWRNKVKGIRGGFYVTLFKMVESEQVFGPRGSSQWG